MSDGAHINSAQRQVMVGAHVVEGRAPGNYVTWTMAERVGVDVGVDGEGVLRTNGNRSGSCTINLMPSSNSNDVFSAVMAAGAPVPLTVIDHNGRTLLAAPRAKPTKVADVVWSDGGEVRAWTFVFPSAATFVGGMAAADVNSDV